VVQLKTKDEIELMRRAGQVVAQTLEMVHQHIKPGMTTAELDRLIEDFIRSQGAIPAFKNYQGFPASACISIDDEVVHGIPGKRVMKEGERNWRYITAQGSFNGSDATISYGRY